MPSKRKRSVKGSTVKQKRNKLAVVVVGCESSGTRLVTRLFIAAGCHGIATAGAQASFGGWPQYYDKYDPDGETPIVIRRTVPYHPFRVTPDLAGLAKRIRKWGYALKIVVVQRDEQIVARSQVAHGYVAGIAAALEALACDKKTIREWIKGKPNVTLSYETLIKNPLPTINGVLKKCGVASLKDLPEEITDENAKYRGEI